MEIEADRARIMGGVRHGIATGGPVAIEIENRDHVNWLDTMAVEDRFETRAGAADEAWGGSGPAADPRAFTVPRPGHADLAGRLKYGHRDLRDVLERASARETAARVAAGAVGRLILREIGVEVGSWVESIGGVRANLEPLGADPGGERARARAESAEQSPVRCPDPAVSQEMMDRIDREKEAGGSLGGVFTVAAWGVPPGLGTYAQWDRRLDGLLAQAVMSIPGIKGVEIGEGFSVAGESGRYAHDEIVVDPEGGITRATNRAGGIEGGISNGMPILIRAAMKPIPTLRAPTASVDLATGKPTLAHAERSDVCAVPAASVVGEAMAALVLANACIERYGGDTVDQLRRVRS
jgi:chorismate synthase